MDNGDETGAHLTEADLIDVSGFSQEWLWETDTDGHLIRLSGRYEALTGARRDDVLGRLLVELLEPSPTGLAGDLVVILEALTSRYGFAGRVCSLTAAPARLIVVRLSGKPRFAANGSFLGFRGIGTDVTESFQRERAWRDSIAQSELLVATIESCPVSISIADALRPGLPLIYVTPSFTRITGYALHEAIEQNWDFLQGPDTDPITVQRIEDALRGGHPVDVEILNYRKDGTPFWNALMIAPLVRGGRIVAYIGVQNDITDKRAQQQEFQRRHRLQALGQLAGGVAHEINNLLQPILSYTELVQTEIASGHALATKRLGKVIHSAEQARDIVRNVLRFSRTDTNILSDLPFAETISEAVEFVRDLLPATVVVTVRGLDHYLGEGRINAVEMTQIMTNLLSNAAQAMRGRGEITVEATTTRITPYQASLLDIGAGGYCVVTVSDTGPGMDESVLARLFEPFFTTKPVGQGTGLGLSVVYGILQNWRGAISATSAPGRGARFTLHIPLSSALSETAATPFEDF
ncbi:MAG: ATP-binding protein [Rhodospirillaceae bacterium]